MPLPLVSDSAGATKPTMSSDGAPRRALGRARAREGSATSSGRKRLFASAALVLLAVLAVSGCGGPSQYSNALVVHVVAPHCEHEPGQQPLLVVERLVEGWGKATVNEWRTLRRLEQCGEPIAGYSWEGDVLQVWVSDYEWSLRKQARVQLGHRVVGDNTWAVGDEDRLRVDYQHVFLGTIDIGADGAEFIPPAAVEGIVAQLEDRQGCETNRQRKAPTHSTDEWEHADLVTFAVAEEAPDSSWHSDPPPRAEEDGE